MRAKIIRIASVWLLVLVIAIVGRSQSSTCSNSSLCVVPSNAGQNQSGMAAAWASGSTVTVYMNTNDWGQPGSPQYQAVQNGILADGQSMASQNVTFDFVPTDGYPVVNGTNWQVVEKHAPDPNDPNLFGQNDYGVSWGPNDTVATVTWSIIQINPVIVDSNYLDPLQYWTGHEELHNFFLGDCWFCNADLTMMSEGVLGLMQVGLSSPSPYDLSWGSDYGQGQDPSYCHSIGNCPWG
jgi:hypothetical protein